jgi:hypothetical protein
MAAAPTMAFSLFHPAGQQKSSDTATTAAHPIGTRARGYDANYGEAQFIYMPGVASTALGDVVVIDIYNQTTARAVITGGAPTIGLVGVAMSANVASQYGWYMVEGTAKVNAATNAAVGAVYLSSTAGTVDSSKTTHAKISGAAITVAEGSSNAGSGKAVMQLSHASVENLSISTI